MTTTSKLPQRLSVALTLLFILSALAAPAPAHAGQLQAESLSPAPASVRLRIGVTVDGMTIVSPQLLAAAGVDPASVDPRTFALSSLGSPVAIRVTGEADGHFDPDDRLLFFGERFRGPEMDQKYTDERVYWLDIGGAPGPRILDVDATPQGNLTPPTNFGDTVRAEESLLWWTLYTLYLDTQDTWFWTRLQPLASSSAAAALRSSSPLIDTLGIQPDAPLISAADLPISVPDPAPGYPATLRLEEIARAYSATYNPDHRTTIGINGVSLLDQTWDGKVRRVFQATVPAGVLANGSNSVAVGALLPPGLVTDDVYVNYMELDYRRLFKASSAQLDFTAESAGPHEYLISGWAASPVEVWDVTDSLAPRRMTGATVESVGGDVRLRFRANDALGSHFWLQASDSWHAPASARVRPPTGLRDPVGGADVVIVTDASLLSAAQSLASWHAAKGRRPLVTLFEDVVDEFNDGIYHPKAVPAMMAWAQTHWQAPGPAYLTLFGDGHWNFKGFNTAVYPARPNPIPPYLAWVDPWQGEVPADGLYGDLDGDMVPDIALGRIPANTAAEGQVMVDKIVAYDDTFRLEPWQLRSLFVADNADSAGDFQRLTDVIIKDYTPGDQAAQKVYLYTTVPNGTAGRAAIAAAIETGVFMIQYMGHGSLDGWAQEQMWRTIDAQALQNGSRLPIVMSFNCLDGYFAYPGTEALAEVMLRRQGGGSVAAISPSGLGITPDEHNMRKYLLEAMFQSRIREIGSALLAAKRQYYTRWGPNYLLQDMMLYGDPAMRVPLGFETIFMPSVARSN